MKQLTLATASFERYAKTTRRAVFLAEMERVMPWSALCGLIAPVYPKPGNGRPPVGVERMLRIYFLQQWFNLSDPAVEEALYDAPLRRDRPRPRAGARRDHGVPLPPPAQEWRDAREGRRHGEPCLDQRDAALRSPARRAHPRWSSGS